MLKHVNKMRVAELMMLRWMSSKTRKEIIWHENISDNLGAAPMEDKMRIS